MTQTELFNQIARDERYKTVGKTYLREIISMAFGQGAKVQMIQIIHPVPDGLWYSNFAHKQYWAIEVVGGFRLLNNPELIVKIEHVIIKNPNRASHFLKPKAEKKVLEIEE
jgi:hypothetical protein